LDMVNVMNFGEGMNKLAYFKLACLKTKSPIFENYVLQIGATTTVVRDQISQRNHVKIALFFGSKTNEPISNFTAQLANNDSFQTFSKPERIDSYLAPGKQAKQQIIVSFLKVPFTALQMDCGLSTPSQDYSFRTYLPTTINKFMEFKFIDGEDFRAKWNSPNMNIIKTNEVPLDFAIAKSAYEFKNYFSYLIDLKPRNEYDFIQGKKSIKLAGCFELDMPGVEYLLKIVVLPTQTVVFQLASRQENTELGAFVLQTLSFLFRA